MNDQDDDDRLGAYAPPADEYSTFDARDEDAGRGPLLLTATFAVFVLFMGVIWTAYNKGVREGGPDAPPRIVADQEPYRERPIDPGGAETPDTNLDVYNRLTGDSEGVEDVSLRPAPEEPLDGSRPALRVETVNADQTEDEPVTSAPETPAETPANTRATPDITPRQSPDRPAERPAETVAEPAPTVPQTPPGPVPNVNGSWVVQIASFRTSEDAEAAWLAFRTRFSDISSGLAPDVLAADIPNRGVYHRLRIAAFDSRDEAIAFCSTLQERGQDCLVARR